MTRLRIGVAMSGGADSTFTAFLLREEGLQVHGFFMRLGLPGEDTLRSRAIRVAEAVGVPLTEIDLRRSFRELVLDSFVAAYRSGLTPNPCVLCNQSIKFGLLMASMFQQGMERAATGHYARIMDHGPAGYGLHRGRDPGKDQSYFLCRVDPCRLSRVVLPLGEWRKKDVLKRVRALGLDHLTGSESQDVCFLNTGLRDFLRRQGVESRPGEIVTLDGRTVGQHQGIWGYTVGQRRGLGIADGQPWYVLALDGADNRILVGRDHDLWSRRVVIRDLQWLVPGPEPGHCFQVQLRSRQRPAPAVLQSRDRRPVLLFDRPQRAVTPGQYAVLYRDDRLVGSGVIVAAGKEGES